MIPRVSRSPANDVTMTRWRMEENKSIKWSKLCSILPWGWNDDNAAAVQHETPYGEKKNWEIGHDRADWRRRRKAGLEFTPTLALCTLYRPNKPCITDAKGMERDHRFPLSLEWRNATKKRTNSWDPTARFLTPSRRGVRPCSSNVQYCAKWLQSDQNGSNSPSNWVGFDGQDQQLPPWGIHSLGIVGLILDGFDWFLFLGPSYFALALTACLEGFEIPRFHRWPEWRTLWRFATGTFLVSGCAPK